MCSILNAIKILFLFFFIMWMMSCKSQAFSKSKAAMQPTESIVSKEKARFQDPLFFHEGQLCQHLRKIYQDRNGNLWFGTNVYNLMLFNGDTLRYIGKKEGFSEGRVTGIAKDEVGNIWFATGMGLNKYDGESFTLFNEKDGLRNSEIWCVYIDSKGIIWIGHNEGLSRFDGDEFEDVEVPKSLVKDPDIIFSEDRITAIQEDKYGNLWLGTDGYGICRYDGKKFKHFTEEDGLCDNTINELMVDTKGNVWIGTFGAGVCKYDGHGFNNYTKDGLIEGNEVGGFFEDRNGDIWFGVENNGVYKYDGKNFNHYYKEQGLDGIILSIYRDKEQRFWFGGWGGLFRFQNGLFTPVSNEGPWN